MNIDTIRSAIEHAPPPAATSHALAGWTDGEHTICAKCADRLCGRGCSYMLQSWRIVWDGTVKCSVCA